MSTEMPWELARHLPWRALTSPAERWATMPSFVIGEYLFIGLALTALWHARASGRAHLLVWLGALIAGTANDLIFMALPLVDNFWQAQATIMLTPRLPLYIPCVYVCFMYLPTVSVWRLGLPLWPQAALSGLCGGLFYAPYDIVGAKFLWWTWHDTDKPIASRLLGAPIGSTIWVLTFVMTFALLIGWAVRKSAVIDRRAFFRGVALVAGLTTVLMVVQMTVLQQLDGGAPGPRGLCAVALVYAGVATWGIGRRRQRATLALSRPAGPARPLWVAIAVYFVTLAFIMASFDPSTHASASLHQTVGECYVEASDITGMTRHQFLCAEDFDEDFSFACLDSAPGEGERWYTVCGKPHDRFARMMTWLALLCAAGLLVYRALLSLRAVADADGDRG